MRNGRGRFTRDVDLARARDWNDADELKNEFEEILAKRASDPFRFEVTSVRRGSVPIDDGYATPTVNARISVSLGAKRFHTIRVDITRQRHTQIPPEKVRIDPLFTALAPSVGFTPFEVWATPVESHLADKICAMYEQHPSGPSGRFHDLADIIQIIRTQSFEAGKLAEALRHEAARRKMTVPRQFLNPGGDWVSGFESNAPSYTDLPEDLHTLDEALGFTGACLHEVLGGQRAEGRWSPTDLRWSG